jgi:organic radical activating enzyme
VKEKPIAYSEIFYSIQGEGHYTGVPTVWFRFFLCNLQCDGFGQDEPTQPDTWELPYQTIDVTDITDVKDLPVWEKGCDSSYSWSKKFRHLQTKHTPREILDVLEKHMASKHNPAGAYVHEYSKQRAHLCFTGGEPMMKHGQIGIVNIMQELRRKDNEFKPNNITIETNGTHELSTNFYNFMGNGGTNCAEIFFSCSPKLFTVSGELRKRAIDPAVKALPMYDRLASQRNERETPKGQLKFVMGPRKEQWEELDEVLKMFRGAGVNWPVWIMPVGATVEGQKLVDGDVATMAQDRGFNVSARVHTYLYGNIIGV